MKLFNKSFLKRNYKRKYTGLRDKNNKKIFEGDILKYLDITKFENIGKVIFDSYSNSYFVQDNMNYGLGITEDNVKNMEVIGNINNNPELMEIETEYQKNFKRYCELHNNYYFSSRTLKEPLIFEEEDWNQDEWKTICKIFNMKTAERIVVKNCTVETYGTYGIKD